MTERLHKMLAASGVTSRRKAEALIAAGRVTVNGVVAAVGQQVEEGDEVAIDGEPLTRDESRVYIALNKPRGVVSSAVSSYGDTSVVELVQVPQRVYPVGRLDKDSAGLLLLTNDGEWANLVTHPRHGVEKEYLVTVERSPSDAAVARIRTGIDLPDGTRTAPARVRATGSSYGRSRFSVTVVEGKKRQIRLMFAAIGHPVTELVRVRVGPIELGTLQVGQWRRLAEEEVTRVRDYATQPQRGSSTRGLPHRHRRPGVRG